MQLRQIYQAKVDAKENPRAFATLERQRALGLMAVAAQRTALDLLRTEGRVNVDEYNLLLEELDWRELSLLPAEQR